MTAGNCWERCPTGRRKGVSCVAIWGSPKTRLWLCFPENSPVENLRLTAVHRVFQKGLPVWSLLVGDGVERGAMEEFSQRQGIRNSVVTGFVNQSSIPAYYAAAEVTAITSFRDPHPLLVTEGVSFGLPVIVSDRVGCIGPSGPRPVPEDIIGLLWNIGNSGCHGSCTTASDSRTATSQCWPRSSAARNRRSIAV